MHVAHGHDDLNARPMAVTKPLRQPEHNVLMMFNWMMSGLSQPVIHMPKIFEESPRARHGESTSDMAVRAL